MKNLELEKFGVVEMNTKEMEEVDGGYWWLLPYGIYLYDNRERFIEGVKKGIQDFN